MIRGRESIHGGIERFSVGCRIRSSVANAPANDDSSDSDSSDSDDDSDDDINVSVAPVASTVPEFERSTHFLAIKINCDQIKQKARELQMHIVDQEEVRKLHLILSFD